MEKALITISTPVKSMKENGLMERNKAKESTIMLMAMSTLVNGKEVKEMVMGHFLMLLVLNTKVSGKMINLMVKE